MVLLNYLMVVTNALLLVEVQYLDNYCSGPPDNIYVFETNYAYSFLPWFPSLNETWPPYYKFHSIEATVGSPGSVFVVAPGQTCFISLDYARSSPYYSGYTLFYTGGYGLDTIPQVANGLQYCFLTSNDFSNSSNLNGYKAAYFRPSDNACYDDHYGCSTGGVFTYYSDLGCSGAAESIVLSTQLLQTPTRFLGNISSQLYTVQAATLFFSWMKNVPHALGVPRMTTVGDWCALIFAVSSLVIGLIMLYKTFTNLRNAKGKLTAKLINFIAQICFLGYYIGSVVYWCTVVTQYQQAVLSTASFVTLGVGTLLDCILTSFLVSDVLFERKKKIVQCINVIFIVSLHIATFGSSYGGMYILNIGPPTYPIPLLVSMGEWQKLSVFWILFTFIYNTTVPILVGLKLIRIQALDKDSKREMNKVDPNLKYYIACQFVAFGMYATAFVLQNYTYALGSDFGYQNAIPYCFCGMAFHTFLTSKIFGIISASSHYVSNKICASSTTPSKSIKRQDKLTYK
ncbi:hypothetical protein HDV01_001579 [Terramyces sp. JEL0728]|nr:hypothetical protein HDV01_001579 [Terramyces sp. JEL0728]